VGPNAWWAPRVFGVLDFIGLVLAVLLAALGVVFLFLGGDRWPLGLLLLALAGGNVLMSSRRGSRRYPPSVTSRFRRADDAFERGIERMVPRSWGVKGPSRGSSLIGLGLAWIIGSTVLLVVSLLTDRAMLWPVAFLVVGLLALPTGIWLNRRSSE
jgi:hypothetical protein